MDQQVRFERWLKGAYGRNQGECAFPGEPFASFIGFTLGKDAHLTRGGAIKAAEAMRKKKLAALKKQITKLEAMKF